MEENEEGKKILEKLRTGAKLSMKEAIKLNQYVAEKNKTSKILKKDFFGDYMRIFGEKPREFKNKLRDEKGKRIQLKNNKYKIVTNKPSPFMSSQFVGMFKFTYQVTKNNKIVKVVPGYSRLLINASQYKEEDLIKLVTPKALAQFMTSIGYSDGSGAIRSKIKIELVDKFWVTYASYDALINYNISQVT